MGGIGGRLSIPMRDNVRFLGIESDVDESDRTDAGGGGGESGGRREVICEWSRSEYVKVRSEGMKGDQPHKWQFRDEQKNSKILPHLPLMLASSAPLGVLGLLPWTLRSEKWENIELC